MVQAPSREQRQRCASELLAGMEQANRLAAFVGLDGFVDEILHVVDKRQDADTYQRLTTIAGFGQRVSAAAGKSTNVELVGRLTKLGGNGPIMANALASLGPKVTYLGTLGYPHLHPVFAEFATRAEVHSIAEPGHTDALEFEDGKIMLGKHSTLKEVSWQNIQARFGREQFAAKLAASDLVAFVNWTMLPNMSQFWSAIQQEVCPSLNQRRRKLFFDLADPEKRHPEDILGALELIAGFERQFEVILGLNEKEAYEIGAVLSLDTSDHSPEGLAALAHEIHARAGVSTLVVHPVAWALTVSGGKVSQVAGPFTPKPLITTGAGDHFNSGFCLGKLLGFDDGLALLAGVGASGHYVRTGRSPELADLAGFLRNWPQQTSDEYKRKHATG
jgi:sugar/nucleoside kinase (ribokinase family)